MRSRGRGRDALHDGKAGWDLIERLPAKSTSEVAKEDEQNRRLIDDLKQGAARFRSILAQYSDQLFLVG